MAKKIDNYDSVVALRKKLKEQAEPKKREAVTKPATADKKQKTAEKDTK